MSEQKEELIKQLEAYQSKKEEAILCEQYEIAARYRDKANQIIKEIERLK